MKSVTPEELIDLAKPYLIGKMMDNAHKGSPFKLEFQRLIDRSTEERAEKIDELTAFVMDPTDENREDAAYEMADVINFELYQFGKLMGIDELERGPQMKDKPRGIRNNNPGNIRENQYVDYAWDGEAEGDWDPDFEEFTEMVYGIRAMAKILITYRDKHHLKTPEQVIKRWAPAKDHNDTKAYIAHVESRVNRKCWDMQSKVALEEYVRAICTHENGPKWAGEWMRYVVEGVGMAG